MAIRERAWGPRAVAAILAGVVLARAAPALADTALVASVDWTADEILVRVSLVILAVILPAAILMGRGAVRRARLGTLVRLETVLAGVGVTPDFASLAIVKNRYCDERAAADRYRLYVLPILIYAGISFIGFYSAFILAGLAPPWEKANVLLAGLADPAAEGFALKQRQSAAVVTFAFFGAYVWSITYLIRRIANYDLSPLSFLRTSGHTIFACFTVGALWHLGAALEAVAPTGTALPLAFLVGFFPSLGLDTLVRRFPALRAKRMHDAAGSLSPALPLPMLDGIDWFVAFRLGELEIEDAQNLACANPFELFASTPYGLYQIMDWMAQAQLLIAVGPERILALRRLNVRTIQDIGPLRDQPDLRRAAQAALLGDSFKDVDDPLVFDRALLVIADDLHVRRLERIWTVLAQRYDAYETEPVAPKALRLATR